jgi:tetratricopeptide (TPR) repeat protein
MQNRFALAAVISFFAAATLHAQDFTQNSIWLPARPWALQMQAPDFSVKANGIQPDGRRYFLAENKVNSMVASVYLEAMQGTPAAGECQRSLHDKESRFAPLSTQGLKDVVYSEKDGMEILEYLLPDAKGAPIKQHNVFACLIKDNVFVDIHLSKSLYTPADKPAFDELLASFRFVDKAPAPATSAASANAPAGNSAPAGSALQLFRKGSFYYISQKYPEAIGPYQQALDLEKANPTLEKKFWYVLVDNLTIAYGITGDLASSENVARYGISKDPDYPVFYYNLACAAAEKGDAAGAKTNLKLAYDRRANVLPGETFSDARTDDSFQKLMQQRDFRDFADTLYSSQ